METNILTNPHTVFLAPTNSTVNIIKNIVIDVLFGNQMPLMTKTNGLQHQMTVYRNVTVITWENRYVIFYPILLLLIMITTIYLYATSEYPQLLLSYSSPIFIKYLEMGFIIE